MNQLLSQLSPSTASTSPNSVGLSVQKQLPDTRSSSVQSASAVNDTSVNGLSAPQTFADAVQSIKSKSVNSASEESPNGAVPTNHFMQHNVRTGSEEDVAQHISSDDRYDLSSVPRENLIGKTLPQDGSSLPTNGNLTQAFDLLNADKQQDQESVRLSPPLETGAERTLNGSDSLNITLRSDADLLSGVIENGSVVRTPLKGSIEAAHNELAPTLTQELQSVTDRAFSSVQRPTAEATLSTVIHERAFQPSDVMLPGAVDTAQKIDAGSRLHPGLNIGQAFVTQGLALSSTVANSIASTVASTGAQPTTLELDTGSIKDQGYDRSGQSQTRLGQINTLELSPLAKVISDNRAAALASAESGSTNARTDSFSKNVSSHEPVALSPNTLRQHLSQTPLSDQTQTSRQLPSQSLTGQGGSRTGLDALANTQPASLTQDPRLTASAHSSAAGQTQTSSQMGVHTAGSIEQSQLIDPSNAAKGGSTAAGYVAANMSINRSSQMGSSGVYKPNAKQNANESAQTLSGADAISSRELQNRTLNQSSAVTNHLLLTQSQSPEALNSSTGHLRSDSPTIEGNFQLSSRTEFVEQTSERGPKSLAESVREAVEQRNTANLSDSARQQLQQNISQQLMARLSKISMAQDQFRIDLTPRALGSLTVDVEVTNREVTVHIFAREAATRELVEQTLPRLKGSMTEGGLELTDAEVGDYQEEQAQGRSAFDHPSHDKPSIANAHTDAISEKTNTDDEEVGQDSLRSAPSDYTIEAYV